MSSEIQVFVTTQTDEGSSWIKARRQRGQGQNLGRGFQRVGFERSA
jgi:hypothetical protein